MEDSKNLINSLDSLFTANGLSERHYLGRAFFQKELVDFQTNEIRRSTIISGILITLFLFFLYRKPLPVFITLSTVGIGLLIFMGILSMMGKELTALSALFPVLMLIVGSSDVIHIYTKYSDELKNTYDKYQAMWVTIRQIGLATLITSLTTAFGFASLYTSKLASIQEFGLQCAIGVVIAYVVVLFYMIPLLLMVCKKD
ncbi:MAG: MMPL family transporter [Saprospiraceae bacterium]|nr:MMPL family transporter [Saprospiraceae bacterium]